MAGETDSIPSPQRPQRAQAKSNFREKRRVFRQPEPWVNARGNRRGGKSRCQGANLTDDDESLEANEDPYLFPEIIDEEPSASPLGENLEPELKRIMEADAEEVHMEADAEEVHGEAQQTAEGIPVQVDTPELGTDDVDRQARTTLDSRQSFPLPPWSTPTPTLHTRRSPAAAFRTLLCVELCCQVATFAVLLLEL